MHTDMGMTSTLSAKECVQIMRVVVKICETHNDTDKLIRAHRTICAILDSEEPDPWERAKGHAQLAVAETAVGIDASEKLCAALKVLRKRSSSDHTVLRAACALVVQPKKRMRRRHHPEDVM